MEPEGPDLGSCERLVGTGLRGEELSGREFEAQGWYEVGDGGHDFSATELPCATGEQESQSL